MNNYKIIRIERHYNLIEMQQSDASVQAWLGESYRPIGPYFDAGGKSVAKGLTMDEQRLLMPEILGVEPADKEFRKEVEKFFHELLTNVPKTGLELNISLMDDERPLGVDNLPIVPRDYIVWRHATKHPHVAHDKSDAERNIQRRFYMIDPQSVKGEALKINRLEDQASSLYFKYKDDDLRVDQILTMMGMTIKGLKKDDKVLKLKEFTKAVPGFNEVEQKDRFTRFIEVCEDKDLSIKFLIEELVGAQYLERVGRVILLKDTGERLGDSIEEAVLFVTNKKNTKLYNQLKAQYGLKIRKGVYDLSSPAEDKAE